MQDRQALEDGVIALVLGGGRGSRLHPLTRDRAKPAVGFGGKYRLVDIPITNCLHSGIERIFLLTQFNSHSLNRHVWQAYSREMRRDGFIDVLAAEQTPSNDGWFQGTADAVRKSLGHLLSHRPKRVLILSGDQIYHFDFRKLLQWHMERSADVTICAHLSTPDEIHALGVVGINPDLTVRGFYEKPSNPDLVSDYAATGWIDNATEARPFLGSMGIYLFETDKLIEALEHPESDFGHNIIPAVAQTMRMYCYPFDGYWEDVGTIRNFYEANMLWREGRGICEAFQLGEAFVTNARQLAPSRVTGILEASLVAEGCDLKAERIVRSIIGLRTTIGPGSIIEDSIVMGDDEYREGFEYSIGSGCTISKTILDKNVVVGKNSTIANLQRIVEGETPWGVVRDGIVVVPKGTVIPQGTRF